MHRGDFVGRADVVQLGGQSGSTYQLNWRLDRIRDGDVVLVREDPNNPDVPAATKVIPLRPRDTRREDQGRVGPGVGPAPVGRTANFLRPQV